MPLRIEQRVHRRDPQRDNTRGLIVSPDRLLQDQLVQGRITYQRAPPPRGRIAAAPPVDRLIDPTP
jgi:hypothetical protein